MTRNRFFISVVAVLLAVLSACSGGGVSRQVIAVTIPPVRAWAEELAGDRFDVLCVVPDGGNPESFDLPPSTMARLAECPAYFSCGYLGFERAWLGKIALNNPQMQVVNMAEGIELIYGTHHHHGEEAEAHDADEHDACYPDPHLWCSPRRARLMVRNMYEALCRLDPDGRAVYDENYSRLDARMALLDSTLTARLAPDAGRAFAIYHPTLTYWAADYGVHQLALEPEGKSPSPQYLRQMVDSARHCGVEVVFVQREFDPKQAETFSREVGCRTEIINPLSYAWESESLHIADAFDRK